MKPFEAPLARKPQSKTFPKKVIEVDFKPLRYYNLMLKIKSSECQFLKLEKPHFGPILGRFGLKSPEEDIFQKIQHYQFLS